MLRDHALKNGVKSVKKAAPSINAAHGSDKTEVQCQERWRELVSCPLSPIRCCCILFRNQLSCGVFRGR